MSNGNARERDLVLAPNEYAYISDQTKGHIVAYVGPYKSSMANTDQPVYFDEIDKRFKICSLERSIKSFTIAPEGWYVMLKNPPKDNKQPTTGTANNLPNLDVGRKVNIPGPAFFALWPGQMVRVIQGHRLRSNQYLIVRVYEEEQAQKNWENAVIKPQGTATEITNNKDKEVVPDKSMPDLSVGKLFVIKGSNVSFYIPPTGIEVVRDAQRNYVRDAVTLERLEYCILLDENGNKRYVKGPDVVIPEPTEAFFVRNGQRKFRAIELSETSGIYVKVISPYTENDKSYNIGDELFITGKEQMIYYSRLEHALIKYGGKHEIYQAIAIPPGEGRYYLNRKTGQISLKKGPCMFLPDPREAIIVQRILSPKQAALWYPGNHEVLAYNQKLSELAQREQVDDYLTPTQVQQFFQEEVEQIQDVEKFAKAEIVGDAFDRSQTFTSSRTITLDTKFQGAVTVEVWMGYAVLVVGKSGTRKVIVGPQAYQLEYDENLAVIELSSGKPKTDNNLIRTVYLRVLYNKVSDIVYVETNDLCPAKISLSYRVNFTGDPEKWFNVENYVKFLTDHMRSVIRNAVKKHKIMDFYTNGIDILRDTILGVPDEQGNRTKGLFSENGMHIYDVEILNIEIEDDTISEILFEAQHDSIQQRLEISSKKNTLDFTKQIEDYNRKINTEKNETKLTLLELSKALFEKEKALELTKTLARFENSLKELEGKSSEQDKLNEISNKKLQDEKAQRDMMIMYLEKTLKQDLERMQAEVEATVKKAEAVSPDLVAALQAFSDRALAEKMAQSMAPLSILGGGSVAEVFSNMLRGTVLEDVLRSKIRTSTDKASNDDFEYEDTEDIE